MTIRQDPTPPVDCDVCDTEITASIDGFLDSVVVDLHDGTRPKDVCGACKARPLTEIFPHIVDAKSGNRLRPASAKARALEEARRTAELEEKTPAPAAVG
jgi:hypothetical protein